MISNFFILLANRRSCNLVSKDKFLKRDCKCELVGFQCLEKLGSKTFLFRKPECDPVPELMISCQKIKLLVIVSRYGITSTG